MIAFASSLDQAGPITKDVTDAAIMLAAIAGHDPLDSTSVDSSVPNFPGLLSRGVKGLRIGIPKEYFIEGMDSEVSASVNNALDCLKKKARLPCQ